MFRWGWKKLEAKLVDQKFVRRYETSARSDVHFQEWDYMVELPAGVEGPAKRLVIREKTLVNSKRTKALPRRACRELRERVRLYGCRAREVRAGQAVGRPLPLEAGGERRWRAGREARARSRSRRS